MALDFAAKRATDKRGMLIRSLVYCLTLSSLSRDKCRSSDSRDSSDLSFTRKTNIFAGTLGGSLETIIFRSQVLMVMMFKRRTERFKIGPKGCYNFYVDLLGINQPTHVTQLDKK